ncbi:MAG: tRNA (adenosine(37)-N6)-threonylcarbamoyltransferase complex ATPase subunit type 1 TsaE [Gemmatimonadaceae bacterium]|nr:tRNA (adenosine(37)-N6)-threonylcarbamoyltransferase complex ATPase subunit type 1 TsaE [Gemmatimonadaceae bacterium]
MGADVADTGAALQVFAVASAPLREHELVAWGQRLGATAPLPLVVTLSGPLGAGKTTLARAILDGAGVDDATQIGSPTFALAHEHATRRGPVAHLDLYRLRGPDDVLAIGFDALLERHPLVLIEWADRAAGLLPRPHLAVTLEYAAEGLETRVLDAAVVPA